MNTTHTEERRGHPRIALETPVIFTLADGDPHDGTSQNISASGIYIITNHYVKLGTHIKLKLEHTDKTLLADGKVVRCKFDKKVDVFHICVQFSKEQTAWMHDQFFSAHPL